MKAKLVTLAVMAVATVASMVPTRVTAQAPTPVTAVPPVLGTPFYQGVPQGATIPRIVPEQCNPRPLSENVSSALQEIRITFDQPMDTALFYWPLPLNDPYFPFVRAEPFWTNGNRTIVLPVQLADNRVYSIAINSPTLVFRGATGLYVNPGLFRFATGTGGGGSASVNAVAPALQNRNGNFGPVIPTVAPGLAGGSSPSRTGAGATAVAPTGGSATGGGTTGAVIPSASNQSRSGSSGSMQAPAARGGARNILNNRAGASGNLNNTRVTPTPGVRR